MTAVRLVMALALVSFGLLVWPRQLVGHPTAAPSDLPARLGDAEFWHLVEDFSEPNGYFDSDNLISNEDLYETVIPELARTVPAGEAYLGVGPDQNFAYILAIAPRLSFITDIRRGNLHVHLMYKALLDLSVDRAEFLSRLFARPRPSGLRPTATADDLLGAYEAVPTNQALYRENLRAITDDLTKRHGFALEPGDLPGITSVYEAFVQGGPSLTFVSSRPGNRYPTFRELQTATDGGGVNRGYLANEALFDALKADEERNAIVPLVGNFSGPHALRTIGGYLHAHGAVVGAFYTSNVEQYLFQEGGWDAFVANVRSLPIDERSTFIRSCFNRCSSPGGSRAVTLLDSMPGLLRDDANHAIRSYDDVLLHSHAR